MIEKADVVVVGAGLAGLSCAYALRDQKIRILESSARAGGRVLSVPNAFVTVDLGACFAVRAEVFPYPESANLGYLRIAERGPLRVLWNGVLVSGDTAWDCLERLPWGEATHAALTNFCNGTLHAAELPPDARSFIDALFKQIHPGSVTDYIVDRQRDAFHSFFPDHYSGGNGCVVDAYLQALGPNVTLSLSSRVIALTEQSRRVIVEYETADGDMSIVSCSAAVIATPATIARTLIRPTSAATAAFLDAVEYGTYTAVGLVFDAPSLDRFRYLVTPELPMDVVIQQSSNDGRYRSLICYYSDPTSKGVPALKDDALVDKTVACLNQSQAGDSSRSRLMFHAIERWPLVGTVLSPEYFRCKTNNVSRATDRIFLAGDYVSSDPKRGYGTVDAVNSGKDTACVLREA